MRATHPARLVQFWYSRFFLRCAFHPRLPSYSFAAAAQLALRIGLLSFLPNLP